MSIDLVACGGAATSTFSLGASTGAHGTTETTMFSTVLPLGAIGTTGNNMSTRAAGIASSTAVPPSLTLRMKYDSTAICTLTATPPALAANLGWFYGSEVTTRGSSLVQGQAWFLYPATPQGAHSGNTTTTAPGLGATVTVSITGQWGATTAGNTFTMSNALADIGGLTP